MIVSRFNRLVQNTETIINTVPSQKSPRPAVSYYSSSSTNPQSKSPTWNNYNSNELAIGGITSAEYPSYYDATFTPKEGYAWSSEIQSSYSVGKHDPITVTWAIIPNPFIYIRTNIYANTSYSFRADRKVTDYRCPNLKWNLSDFMVSGNLSNVSITMDSEGYPTINFRAGQASSGNEIKIKCTSTGEGIPAVEYSDSVRFVISIKSS
jgi:hypothetical protein